MMKTPIGYYPTFALPAWWAGPDALTALLRMLYNRRYPDLYEAVTHDQPDGVVADAYTAIIAALWGEGDLVGRTRLLYLAWSLALASLPTIEAWAPAEQRPHQTLRAVETWCANPQVTVALDWATVFPPVVTPPQALHEALDVSRQLLRMLGDAGATQAAASEILDDCIEGYAIVAGAADERRDLFNWLLLEVIPAAWSLRLPDAIYTFRWPWPPTPGAQIHR